MRETINQLESCLATAVVSAFELMCFTTIEASDTDTDIGDDLLRGEIQFDGDATGRLRLEMSKDAACAIAADFYGESDEPSMVQAEAVIGEMTNVICGCMLSTYAPDGGFCLSTPEVTRAGRNRFPTRQCFRMESGDVVVSLTCEDR